MKKVNVILFSANFSENDNLDVNIKKVEAALTAAGYECSVDWVDGLGIKDFEISTHWETTFEEDLDINEIIGMAIAE